MNSRPEESHNSSTVNETLTQKNLPIETTDGYLKEHGIEPSAIKIGFEYTSPEETSRAKQRDIHQQKMKFSRFIIREVSAYIVGYLLIFALISVSIVAFFDKSSSTDSQAWARSTLTALGTAIAGYLFGKSSAS